MKKFIIALGTTSQKKIGYIKEVLKEIGLNAELIPTDVESQVSEQPLSEKETLQGSINRAKNALSKVKNADFSLGIEVGYHLNSKEEYEILGFASITDNSGFLVSSISSKFILSQFWQEKLRKNLPLGKFVKTYFEENPNPTAQYITEITKSRKPFIVESVRNVLLSYMENKLE